MDTLLRVLTIDGPLIAAWLLPAAVVAVFLIASRGDTSERRRRLVVVVRLVTLVYLAGVVLITLYPFDFAYTPSHVNDGNWEPFDGTLGFILSDDPRQNYLGGRDVFANIVLFAPLGFLLPFAFYQWRGLALSIFILGLVAFGCELVQGLWVEERTFDIDDAIAGFAGGVVATLVAGMLRPFTLRAH